MADIPNEPINRHEQYLNAIATGDSSELPTPITREEAYLDHIAKNGGGGGGGGFSPPQFSTNETDTGYKWIDGKTIYSRVITDTFNSGGGTYYDGFTNANVLGISGTRSQSSITVFTGVYNSNSSFVDTVEMSEDGGVKKLHYYAGGAGNVAIIVYYTKTTD